MGGQGLYLYGFARPGALASASLTGLDDRGDVAAHPLGSVAAVCSLIDLDDFQGEAGEKNLQDPQWVIPLACRHERVVEWIMASSPVLPVRFGAVFSTAEALAAFVERHGEAIAAFLDAIAGEQEWAVKGFVDPERATAALIEADPELAELQRRLPAAPGTRYFREKQLLAEAGKRLEVWCRNVAIEIESELRGLALDVRPLRPRGTHQTAPTARPVLNFALLLPEAAADAFRSRLKELAAVREAQGLLLECSGPWPPYNFAPDLGEVAP